MDLEAIQQELADWLIEQNFDAPTSVMVAFDLLSDAIGRRAPSQLDNSKLTRLCRHGYGAVTDGED